MNAAGDRIVIGSDRNSGNGPNAAMQGLSLLGIQMAVLLIHMLQIITYIKCY